MIGALLLVLAVQANTADHCAVLDWHLTDKAWGATHPRVLSVGRDVARKADLRWPLVLCQSSLPYGIPLAMSKILMDPGGDARVIAVLIPEEVADTYSDEALNGIMAHEIAHGMTPADDPCHYDNRLKVRASAFDEVRCEAETDARAAQWVGADALIAELNETLELILPFVEDGYHRQLLKAEVQLRIVLLERLRRERERKGDVR